MSDMVDWLEYITTCSSMIPGDGVLAVKIDRLQRENAALRHELTAIRNTLEAVGREKDELHKLCRRLDAEVSELADLADCKETLRHVGLAFGCDHVDTADDRGQLVNCAEQQFSAMDDLARDAERWRECERHVRRGFQQWRLVAMYGGDTFAAAIDAAIAKRKGKS